MSEQMWRKSSYSGSEAECVEVTDTIDVVMVRDTTNRDGETLGFSAAAWATFTGALKQA
jgi:Domain of unknown function (DUF397)